MGIEDEAPNPKESDGGTTAAVLNCEGRYGRGCDWLPNCGGLN